MGIFTTTVNGLSGSIEVEVHYRMKPWGVDLDEVYINGTSTVLPLTSPEYARIAKEISAHLANERNRR